MKNKTLFCFSFAGFLLVMAGMLWTEQQAGCGKIIIPLELSENIAAFKQLAANCNLLWIERNTELDFVFLLAYSAALFFAFRWLMESMGMSPPLRRLTGLLWLPGLFDAIENIHLIKFLYADAAAVSTGSFAIYYWCVRIKFALLIIAVLVLFVLLGKKLLRKA